MNNTNTSSSSEPILAHLSSLVTNEDDVAEITYEDLLEISSIYEEDDYYGSTEEELEEILFILDEIERIGSPTIILATSEVISEFEQGFIASLSSSSSNSSSNTRKRLYYEANNSSEEETSNFRLPRLEEDSISNITTIDTNHSNNSNFLDFSIFDS